MLKKLLVASLVSLPMAAQAFSDYGAISRVTPEYEDRVTSREECWDETATAPTRDRGVAGAVVGGAAGAGLGSRFGEGKGRAAATIIGAIGGAVLGDRVQNDGMLSGAGGSTRRCRPVEHRERVLAFYRVDYTYGGREFSVRLHEEPRGRELPVSVEVVPMLR